MSYQILRTAKADEQLRDIILYRAEVTGSADAALELLDRLESEIALLSNFPESGTRLRYAALRARGYRILIVEKYLVFYKADKKCRTVIIHAIIDARRDYLNLL